MINEETLLKSKKYYEKVTEILFKPLEELQVKIVHHKGDCKWWKLFWFIPIFKITYNEDRYSNDYISCCYSRDGLTFNELQSEYNIVMKNGKIYKKATVTVTSNGHTNKRSFSTNEEAINFFNDVKRKCEESHNALL